MDIFKWNASYLILHSYNEDAFSPPVAMHDLCVIHMANFGHLDPMAKSTA